MKDEILAHLHDIVQAGQAIREFIADTTFETYASNEMLRSAVERKFEIMGEAINRIRSDNPELLSKIRNHRDIISFRNILIHGYDSIDDRIVWGIIKEDLNDLIEDVNQFLLH